MCLMARSLSLEFTTFLIHWDVHGSTVFIQPCLDCLSPFSRRIAVARGLDNSVVFFWLGHLSTLSGRITRGDSAVFAGLFSGLFKIEIFGVSVMPVDLNPLLLHLVSSRLFSSFSLSRLIFLMINWAMQSPVFISNCMSEWFTNRTLTSSR